MNFNLIFVLLFIFSKVLLAQKGDSSMYFLNNYELEKSTGLYEKKITSFKYKDKIDKRIDMYNLACAYSLSENIGNCYKYLLLSFEQHDKSYDVKLVFYTDPDFYNMLNDKRWQQFVKEHAKYSFELPDSLLFELSKIAIRDQALYKKLSYLERKYGLKSTRVKQLWTIKDSLNKVNLESVEKLIGDSSVNVLSSKQVGEIFASKCFLVFQHSDTSTMIKYLPIIKSLYDKGETKGENYALLYDRVHVNRFKGLQYYGTQVNTKTNTVYPIKNEINVDKRRKELGMEPLKDYLLKFGIFYTPKR